MLFTLISWPRLYFELASLPRCRSHGNLRPSSETFAVASPPAAAAELAMKADESRMNWQHFSRHYYHHHHRHQLHYPQLKQQQQQPPPSRYNTTTRYCYWTACVPASDACTRPTRHTYCPAILALPAVEERGGPRAGQITAPFDDESVLMHRLPLCVCSNFPSLADE